MSLNRAFLWTEESDFSKECYWPAKPVSEMFCLTSWILTRPFSKMWLYEKLQRTAELGEAKVAPVKLLVIFRGTGMYFTCLLSCSLILNAKWRSVLQMKTLTTSHVIEVSFWSDKLYIIVNLTFFEGHAASYCSFHCTHVALCTLPSGWRRNLYSKKYLLIYSNIHFAIVVCCRLSYHLQLLAEY